MKRLALLLTALACISIATPAQQLGQPLPPGAVQYNQGGPAPGEDLPKFNIDFNAGDVTDLIEQVQQELQKVDKDAFLNVVIPTEYRHQPIPPLKLRNVNVMQLFKALEMASVRIDRTDEYQQGIPQFVQQVRSTRYGFQTTGPVTRESIWHFYVETPQKPAQAKVVRYYQLAPYLAHYSMDDIGKAISAGWNMLGEEEQTKLNFHKETKLLIAVGPSHQIETISMVLKALDLGMTNAAPASSFQERLRQEEQRQREERRKNEPVPKP